MPENQPITVHASGTIPFDFEFFVVAIPLNAPGIILVPDNSFATKRIAQSR